jgi:microcystin-dependent protein
MATPFIGEIRLFPFNFAPHGWAKCEGQLLLIQQNQALYSIIGTRYGGDGVTTFGLPDLRGRAPVMPNGTISLGSIGGEEVHTLTLSEMPSHNHVLYGSSNGTTNISTGHVCAASPSILAYSDQANNTMHPGAIQETGGSSPHTNMQPYLALNYCIALQGIFPPRD